MHNIRVVHIILCPFNAGMTIGSIVVINHRLELMMHYYFITYKFCLFLQSEITVWYNNNVFEYLIVYTDK